MKYSLLLLILLTLFSCKKVLDENPQNVAEGNFYQTAAELEAGVNAIYSAVRTSGCLSALYPVQLDIYSEYLYGRGSHAPLNDYKGLDNTNITRVADMWKAFYLGIRNANIIVQKAPLAKQASETDKRKYISEARFLRALWYFHLVRNWAGVPLRTENNMDSLNVKRSSAADIYAFIEADLLYAEANLQDAPRLPGAPSVWSAKAVLADVYMNLQRYAEARDKAQEIIQSGKFALVNVQVAADFDKLYGPDVATSSEEVFYIKFARSPSSQNNFYPAYAHYPNSGYYPPAGYYTFYSDAQANPFIRNWDKNDLRYAYNWYSQTFGLGPNTILNKKFSDKAAVSGAGNDYPMYRYADILMLYAEAASRVNNGPTADAMEKLNMVHRRAYGKNPLVPDASVDFRLADYGTLQSFLDLLVRERGYETCCEAKRWHELKRMGIVKQTIQAVKGITVADKHLLWPIPLTETNYNKAIDPVKDQNPGY
jgi:hypothetical protein